MRYRGTSLVTAGAIPRDELAVTLAGGDDPDLVRRLSALLMAAEEAFWSLDLQGLSITVSRNLEVAFGHRLTDVGSDIAKWQELIHPVDLPAVRATARAALRSDAPMWSVEMRLRVVDGSYALVRCRASILRDGSGQAIALIGSLSDVSARQSEIAELQSRTHELLDMAAEARAEQSRHRLLERALNEVVWEWDTATNAVIFSGAMMALFGYEQNEVQNTFAWWEERVHPEDRAGVRHSIAMHLADDLDEWIGTYRFRRSDGSYVWVRDRGYLEPGEHDGRRMVGAMSLVDQKQSPGVPHEPGTAHLSPRQAEVLQLVRAGYTNKQIAVRLHIGEQSAKDHVSRLLRLLGAPNRAALVAAADDTEIVRDRRSGPRRASDGSAALFAVTRGTEHALVSASPAVLALTPERSPLGKPLRTAYPELAGQGVFELFDVVLRDGKSASVERLVGRFPRDGSRVTLAAEVRLEPITDEHGRVDGVLAYGVDVSRRVRADASPAAGLTEQMTALEDLPIGAILTDAEGGIVSMNAEARRILGSALADGRPVPEHAPDYSLRDALTGKPLGRDETAIARALRGEVVSRLDYLLRPPGTDTDVVLRTSAMPVHAPDGIVAVLLTFSEVDRREITDEPPPA